MMAWNVENQQSGMIWHGRDSILNPLYAKRFVWTYTGLYLVGAHFFLAWMFAALVGRSGGAMVAGFSSLFILAPGVLLFVSGLWFCRKYLYQEWALEADARAVRYWSKAGGLKRFGLNCLRFALVYIVAPVVRWSSARINDKWAFRLRLFFGFGGLLVAMLALYLMEQGPKPHRGWAAVICGAIVVAFAAFIVNEDMGDDPAGQIPAADLAWIVALGLVARVETGETRQWVPARPGLLGDNPVPPDEVQAFLFMADGSRRVFATEHGGRESLSTLALSVRSFVDALRQPERAAAVAAAAVASDSGEFSL